MMTLKFLITPPKQKY